MDKKTTTLSCVNIVAIKKSKPTVTKHSSGFVVLYDDSNYVVTVSHAIPKGFAVGIVLYPPAIRPNVLFFNPYFINNFQGTWFAKTLTKLNKKYNLNIKVKSERLLFKPKDFIEIAFEKIPSNFDAVHNIYGSPFFGMKKIVLDYSKRKQPQKDEVYYFGGGAYRTFASGCLQFEEIYIDNMEYIETKGQYHIFQCDDDRDLHGCSGAPIFDSNGNLVSMVVEKRKDKLYGMNLLLLDVALQTQGEIK